MGAGAGRDWSPVLLGLIDVAVPGRRRLVTSLSGATGFRWRLMAAGFHKKIKDSIAN